MIADRVYDTIKSIEHCLDAGADFILRIKNKAFHLYDGSGQKIILADWFLTVGEKAAECMVYINENNNSDQSKRISGSLDQWKNLVVPTYGKISWRY